MKNLKLFCETALNVNNLKEELVRDGWNMQHGHCIMFANLCDEFNNLIEEYHTGRMDSENMNAVLVDSLVTLREVILMLEDYYKDVANPDADSLIKSYKSLFDIIAEYYKEI